MALDIVIMAAGQGTRMKSARPKVLHRLAGRALLQHVLDTASALGTDRIIAVTGFGAEQVEGLKGGAMRPQAIALLRAHIVPGVVTRADLEAALQRNGSRPTKMRTMAGGELTFTREGDAIVVSGEGGGRGRLVEETLGSNGAIERVDGLLVPVEAPAR